MEQLQGRCHVYVGIIAARCAQFIGSPVKDNKLIRAAEGGCQQLKTPCAALGGQLMCVAALGMGDFMHASGNMLVPARSQHAGAHDLADQQGKCSCFIKHAATQGHFGLDLNSLQGQRPAGMVDIGLSCVWHFRLAAARSHSNTEHDMSRYSHHIHLATCMHT